MRLLRSPVVAVAVVLTLFGVSVSACGSDKESDEEFPEVVSLGKGEIFPAILNSSLTLGPNRLVLSLTDSEDEFVPNAEVHLRFYSLKGDEPELRFESDARFIPVELSYIDEQAPTPEPTRAGSSGAYVANVEFDATGAWGVRVEATVEGARHEAPFRFDVRERSEEPMIGEQAPPSLQPTIASVAAVEEIDSSFPPRPHMHDITIADALATGKPLVIAFATPGYCTMRLCAPVMDTVMDPLYAKYGEQAHFIHVEPYVLADLRAGFMFNPVPATREWGIGTEPWVFVVGRDGTVLAKFEGVMAADEVEATLQEALSGQAPSAAS